MMLKLRIKGGLAKNVNLEIDSSTTCKELGEKIEEMTGIERQQQNVSEYLFLCVI